MFQIRMLCRTLYHLYNLKNVKNTHGEVLFLDKILRLFLSLQIILIYTALSFGLPLICVKVGDIQIKEL